MKNISNLRNVHSGAALAVAVCLWAFFAGSAWAAGSQLQRSGSGNSWLSDEPEFLPVDEAFVLSTAVAPDGAVQAQWDIADGYYLYRHRFGFRARTSAEVAETDVVLGEPEISPGKRKVDDYFGEVEVYYHQARARVPVVSGGGPVEIGVSYQGCADLGLCYPPETRWVALNLPAPTGGDGAAVDALAPGSAAAPATTPDTRERALASVLVDRGLLGALLVFFVAGIGLAFTPCVLPMIPILSSIIVGDAENITRIRALTLSLAYVIGMALTYAAIGTLVGLFGARMNLQAALQSAPVLIGFAGVFVLLSLAMFGFYELQLPRSWQDRLHAASHRAGGGKHLGVVVMGALSSLVVSPCVSAPLAGALIYLSATGDAVLGGGALLALGFGMGVPLIVIGASGGHLLPRAGAWMTSVKAVFGVMLLAVAIWLLERVVAPTATLLLWSALAIGSGVYLGALDFSPRDGWGQLRKAGGALSFVYGVLLVVGAASGADNPLRPLERLSGDGAAAIQSDPGARLTWQPIDSVAGLEAALLAAQTEGRPVVLDLYADWCISCKLMERSVFPRPGVASLLSQFRLLRADVTDNTADHQALLQRFGLFGPPALVFFADDGRELSDVTIRAEIGAVALRRHLEAVLDRINGDNVVEIAAKIR